MAKWTLRSWGLGLIGAIVNSGFGGIAVVIVDPSNFNPLDGGLANLAKVCLVLGILGAGLYVKEHPIKLGEDE